ncbi:MAG: hydrogenase expression/formation protein HypE [Crenarchaeota archaeon]|nr:hydrogenase expression/formation protein HypE [Thermoproteota archaeon]
MKPRWDKVTLAHGGGGRETAEIVEYLLVSRLPDALKRTPGGYGLDVLDDAAAIKTGDGFIVVSTDSYTVNPPFFPGGDIGHLAASGSINDVLMMGARPIAALDGIVVEEGFPLGDLERIVDSMLRVFRDNNVSVIGGDFKVMPRGSIDKIVVSTTVIGFTDKKPIVDRELRPGDVIIVTGPIAEHGAAILAARLGIESPELRSDSKPLTDLMIPLLESYRDAIHAARDPTRGGLAMTLNEWASSTSLNIVIDEAEIPVREAVRKYAEMLGVDPLTLASEGVAVLAVDPSKADEVLEQIHSLGYSEARVIGRVREPARLKGVVIMRTRAGGLRLVEPPSGEIVPRIC